MPVKVDPSGRRSVQAETEVPGTPEQVWAAIATGPGISAWFVPSEVEERPGGRAVSHFGPGDTMDSVGTVTEWMPPRRFVVETHDRPGLVASEWTVEARSGSTCLIRVVHSWFAEGADFDDEYAGHSEGWQAFFRLLRLYLTHFAGETGASFQAMGVAPEPRSAAWATFTRPFGLAGAKLGDRVDAPAGLPPLGGTVVWAGTPEWPEELIIRTDRPAPGLAHLVPFPMNGKVYPAIRFYLYGAAAAAAKDSAEAAWSGWMGRHFGTVTKEDGQCQ